MNVNNNLNEISNNKNEMQSELNNAKNKIKQLIDELNTEKNKTEKLMKELEIEKNKNKLLDDELKKNKDTIKQLTNNWNKENLTSSNFNTMVNQLNSQIKSLQSDLNAKIIELNNLRNQLNSSNNNNSLGLEICKPGEKIIVVHFKSLDQNVDYPIACKNTDIFVRIEENLYKEFPEYKEYSNTFFTVNGTMIKRFKSMEDNKIKNGDKIILNIWNKY